MPHFSIKNFSAASAKPHSLAGVRPSPVRGWLRSDGGGSGDERGITLQTLIVTAVLVLMAVAAGVVIVAITNNSADDLEDQTSNIEGRCQPWEIHDPQLEAIGAGGGGEHVAPRNTIMPNPGTGGVTSSRIGCLAPCYLGTLMGINLPGSLTRIDLLNARTNLGDFVNGAGSVDIDRFPTRLVFDTSNRPPLPMNEMMGDMMGDLFSEYRLGVTYLTTTTSNRRANVELDSSTGPRYHWGHFNRVVEQVLGTHTPPVASGSKLAVRVTAGQDACVIYNTDTDTICVDSRRSGASQVTGLC